MKQKNEGMRKKGRKERKEKEEKEKKIEIWKQIKKK